MIYGDGEQTRDFTYISNAVDANMLAAEADKGIGEVINIASGERVTINQLFQLLTAITGRDDVEPEYQKARTGDVLHSLADISRARELLGYAPTVGLERGLQATVEWFGQA